MLLKKPIGKSRLYDILHRGAVTSCMGVTVVGIVTILVMQRMKGTNDIKKVTVPSTVKEAPLIEPGSVGLPNLQT